MLTILRVVAVCSAAALLTACSEAETSAPADMPVEVGIVTVQSAVKPFIRELPGRISPTRIAEVRARVSGIVVERTFQQGTDVKAGDVLYRIDPAPFEVELQASEAALAKAQAVLEQATPTGQAHRDAGGRTRRQPGPARNVDRQPSPGRGRRRGAQGRRRSAPSSISNTPRVRAPISGRVGRALVTEGALVGQGEATHLATIQQLDNGLCRLHAIGQRAQRASPRVREGRPRCRRARDRQGAARPRRRHDLSASRPPAVLRRHRRSEHRPGDAARRVPESEEASCCPACMCACRSSRASTATPSPCRSRRSSATMPARAKSSSCTDDNRAILQPVRTGRVVDEHWLVEDGLKPGDRVVVDGFQKFVAGSIVRPVPWQRDRSPASDAPAPTTRSVGSPPPLLTR